MSYLCGRLVISPFCLLQKAWVRVRNWNSDCWRTEVNPWKIWEKDACFEMLQWRCRYNLKGCLFQLNHTVKSFFHKQFFFHYGQVNSSILPFQFSKPIQLLTFWLWSVHSCCKIKHSQKQIAQMNKGVKIDPNTSSLYQYAAYLCRAGAHFLCRQKLTHKCVACLDSLMADD